MDRARQRFNNNMKKLTDYNPDLKVMADQRWIDACTNDYIVHMCKKIWMHDLVADEIFQANKAVTGYLKIQALVESSSPVQTGARVIKGKVVNLKQRCRNHSSCGKHWYANVRTTDNNTIYTPIPAEQASPDLVGVDVEYFAYITVSARDKTFGFAHNIKLMKFKENSHAR